MNSIYVLRKIINVLPILIFICVIGTSLGIIGRFIPTHAIAEPVYCGACHTDQVVELNATTHLPHFAGAILEEAEAIEAGGAKVVTQAEAINGGCMMCHNTWANREKIWVQGYSIVDDPNGNLNGQYQLRMNDANFKPTTDAVMYDVVITSDTQFIRLGTSLTANSAKMTVQDPGTSGLAVGMPLINGTDFTQNATGVNLIAGTNATALNCTGALKITYKVGVSNGVTANLKTIWGDLSNRSPSAGSFYNDVVGANTCGNPEKAVCHAIETTVGKNMMNQMPENQAGINSAQSGYGNGIYFQHEMAYTSAEYVAKQVKFCGVCHFNKLPPMDEDGNPIRIDILRIENCGHDGYITVNPPNDVNITRRTMVHTCYDLFGDMTTTGISNDWAHRQVQCVRCHSHAGIGDKSATTGVRSPK